MSNTIDKTIYGVIYKITNKINNKVYIGQTTGSFNNRYRGNILNTHNEHLKRSIIKYGIDNFNIDKQYDIAQDQEELNRLEDHYINVYNSMDPSKGYNKKGGGSNGKMSEEVKKKMSESTKGELNPMYGKKGVESPNFGKTFSDEHKQKISESLKGELNYMYGKTGALHPMYGKSGVESPVARKIVMLDKNTGGYLKTFYGTMEALKYIYDGETDIKKLKNKRSSIIQVCRDGVKRYITAQGYKWMYEEDYKRSLNTKYIDPIAEAFKQYKPKLNIIDDNIDNVDKNTATGSNISTLETISNIKGRLVFSNIEGVV